MEKDPNRIAQNQEQSFLLGKRSAFERDSTPKKYYIVRKHARNSPSMQNVFLQDFDSQVNPTILPGVPVSVKSRFRESFRILAENGFSILTEFGEPMRIE
jgi:hypothetical protein